MDSGAAEGAGALAHRLQVSAGGEGLTGAGQNGTTDVTVGIDAGAGFREQLAVAVLAQRIARFRPVDGEGDDGTVFLEQQGGHGTLSPGIVAPLALAPSAGAREIK